MLTAWALVVDGVLIEWQWAVSVVELWQALHEEVHERAHDGDRIRRTASNVDGHNAFGLEGVSNAHGLAWIWLSGRKTTEARAGADGHNSLGAASNALDEGQHGLVANATIDTVFTHRDCAFNQANVAVFIGHCGFKGMVRGGTCGGHDGLAVVKGNGIDDEVVEIWVRGAEQGLGTARAFCAVHVDDGWALWAFEGRGHFARHACVHAKGNGNHGTQLHEITT